jgi:hypothetical protein
MPIIAVGIVGLAAITLCVAQIALPRSPTNLLPFTIGGAVLTLVMGLLGTVLGLITAFDAVAGADPSAKSELLAQGISQAMQCTALGSGLQIIIIPLMVIGIVRRQPKRPPPAAAPPRP